MKTLHRYLLRQVLATLLMTVLVFTFVLLLGNLLKQVLELIVSQRASLGLIAEAIGLLIPYAWAYALPMSMMTAVLLVFGRFSADHELTAARASGISLVSLVTPVLLLSLVMCGVCAVVNMEIAPRSRAAFRELIARVKMDLANAQLPEGRFINDFDNYIFYVGKNRRGELENVMVFVFQDKTNRLMTIQAPHGQLRIDTTNQQMNVHLTDAQWIIFMGDRVLPSHGDFDLPIDLRGKPRGKPNLTEMTTTQLREELRAVEQVEPMVAVTNQPPEQSRVVLENLRKTRASIMSRIRVQLHSKIATAFACFGFTLVGIPLGIRVQRRETGVGFFVALLLVMVYYALLLIGLGLDARPGLMPHLIVWLPNFVFQAVGVGLLWRANRGF